MVLASPGVAVEVMRKGQILDLFDCEREQSRQLQGKIELPFTGRSRKVFSFTSVMLNVAAGQLSGEIKEGVWVQGRGLGWR